MTRKLMPLNHYICCTPKVNLSDVINHCVLLVDFCLFPAIIHMYNLKQSLDKLLHEL